jgi:hypothetical protein
MASPLFGGGAPRRALFSQYLSPDRYRLVARLDLFIGE